MNGNALLRVVKALAGFVVILALVFLVAKWFGDYRNGAEKPVAETTSTPNPKTEATSKPKAVKPKTKSPQRATIEILMDGVNFREAPDADSEVIRGLNKGEKLTLLKKQESWYNCEDSNGVRGWLSSNASYSRVLP